MLQTSMALPGFDIPTSPAIAAIDSALKAEFPAKAREFVLTHLRRHGPTSGEDLTDAMLLAGINPPGNDGRRFGPVYWTMSHHKLIESYGVTYRRKGNGTLGATIWRITDKGLLA
jgi:hypothetical protein